jgi:aspartyl-tRNA(Asn)/glutamyl-tRNA(Gln) amidotransferase subunit A
MSEDLCFSTLGELAPLIRARKLSPIRLVRAFLDRIESLNPRINAFVTLTTESALEEAARAERELRSGKYRGPLHGIPFAVKDALATKGIRTTWGCRLFEKQVPDYDATVVERLREAGGVLVGKLSMNELGAGPPGAALNGPVRNPWKLDHWVHGSSTGPAACVAAGFAVVALGVETTSSILGPSAACGITGFRPTYGRVSRYGAMPFSWTMDKVGPMARSVSDCAEVFRAIHGEDPHDHSAVSGPFVFRAKRRKTLGTLGLVRGDFAPLATHALDGPYRQAIERLREIGFAVEEVDLPRYPYREVSSFVWQVESWAVFEPFARSGELEVALVEKDRLLGWKAASLIPSADYLKVLRIRRAMVEDARRLCRRYGALVAPMNPQGARPIEPALGGAVPGRPAIDSDLLRLGSLAGLPAVSVPCGFTTAGLPVGLTFAGPAMGDGAVLEIARAYQAATEWHLKRPRFRD